MTETGPHFTTWRPLQHEPFRDPEAIWYPAVQVDRFVAAQDEEIAKLQEQVRFGKERIDFHLNRANRAEKESDAARAKVEELSGALKGVIRAQHHRRYHRRDHEQCESCKAIGIARRALEEGK
jgi:hypothetical protein